jgi:predicted Zn-dependent protease
MHKVSNDFVSSNMLIIYHQTPKHIRNKTTSTISSWFPSEQVLSITLKHLPFHSYNWKRQQHSVVSLLNQLHPLTILVTNSDLYYPDRTFVFGAAAQGLGIVLSLHRIKHDWFLIEAELKHELGHYFGLRHCPFHCVMHQASVVPDIYKRSTKYCRNCQCELRRHLER